MSVLSPLHRQTPSAGVAATVYRRAQAPVPQEPADPRCDCIPVPPVGYDDEGYPVEDSVGQSQRHIEQTFDSYGAVRDWCQRQGLGEVFSDLFMPYRQGQRSKVVCPDLMVALRAERQQERLSYKLWEHPTPDFVLEATSNSTWRADVEAKKQLYRDLRVREYWLFDSAGKRIAERLRGYRLRRRTSRDGAPDVYGRVRKNRWGRYESKVLKLELCFTSVAHKSKRYADSRMNGVVGTPRLSSSHASASAVPMMPMTASAWTHQGTVDWPRLMRRMLRSATATAPANKNGKAARNVSNIVVSVHDAKST